MDSVISAFSYVSVLILLAAAVVQDLRQRIIKNYLLIIGAALGLALVIVSDNYLFKNWLFGLLGAFAVGFIMWILGMFCAGDAKIFCVVGACWGLRAFVNCFIFTILIGGVCSLVYMIVKKELKIRLKNIFNYIKTMIYTLRLSRYTPDEKLKNDFPFSIFIFSGTLISALTGNGLFV